MHLERGVAEAVTLSLERRQSLGSARYSINAQKSGQVEKSEIVCNQKQILDIKCPW